MVKVPVSDIIERAGNRSNEGKMEPLASVKEMGIQVPLIVYLDKSINKFCLVDGHRRLFTAKKLGLKEVPVAIITAAEADEVYAVANLDRKDLCPLDLYEKAKDMREMGKSTETIAATLKMSKYQLNRYLKLDNLIPELMEQFRNGVITWDVASELASFPQETQNIVKKDKWCLKDAKTTKEHCNNSLGKSLKNFDDDFIKSSYCNGSCLTCSNNRGSDLTLFGESSKAEAVCTCPDLLAVKLQEYAKEKACKGIVMSDYTARTFLEHAHVEAIEKDWISFSEGNPKEGYKNQSKYLSSEGKICWMGGTSKAAKVDKTLPVGEAIKELNAALLSFVVRVAELAYMDEAKEAMGVINTLKNKTLVKTIVKAFDSEVEYILRKEGLSAEETIARLLVGPTVRGKRMTINYWDRTNRADCEEGIKAIYKAWEPVAIKHPGCKKEWDKFIVAKDELERQLEVCYG